MIPTPPHLELNKSGLGLAVRPSDCQVVTIHSSFPKGHHGGIRCKLFVVLKVKKPLVEVSPPPVLSLLLNKICRIKKMETKRFRKWKSL